MMGRILGVMLLLGCAAQPRTGRPAGRPYKDAPTAVAIATGTGTGAAVVATAAVVTVAVGVVVVGAEQYPDPPAGTPQTSTAPKDPPNRCGSCVCFGKGLKYPMGSYHYEPDGAGATEYTRTLCQQACIAAKRGFTGFKCTGDKTVTWFE